MKTLKILVIENDENVFLLFKQLETVKIKIDIVNSGVEAYKKLYKTPIQSQYDYIITNIGLPDENGVEIIKFINMIFTSKIIIYSGKNCDFYGELCKFDYYFNKKTYSPANIIDMIFDEYYS